MKNFKLFRHTSTGPDHPGDTMFWDPLVVVTAWLSDVTTSGTASDVPTNSPTSVNEVSVAN